MIFFPGGSNLGFNLVLRNIIEPKYYGRGLSLALLMQGLGGFVGNPVAGLSSILYLCFPGLII
jgi:hypothetical protein